MTGGAWLRQIIKGLLCTSGSLQVLQYLSPVGSWQVWQMQAAILVRTLFSLFR